MMKTIRAFFLITLGIVTVLCSLVVWTNSCGIAARKACQHNLKSIGCAICLYKDDHDQQLPHALSDISDGILTPLLICPGTRQERQSHSEHGKENMDYIYIDWSRNFTNVSKIPDKFPLIYDRYLSNHDGDGINVMLVDGTVFWDKDTNWITDFVGSNSSYNIPLPTK